MIFNNILWPLEKVRQVVEDPMMDYGRIEWKHTIRDLAKAPDIAYDDILDNFDSNGCVKWLIVTFSVLVVT